MYMRFHVFLIHIAMYYFGSAILHTRVVVKVIIRFAHFATIHQVTCIHLHHMPSSTVVKVIVTMDQKQT